MQGRLNGFYVEVGSHHPFRFSNTYLFYLRGWKGICIDPLPGTKHLFTKWRPRDTAIEIGISSVPSHREFYMFDEPALNTFDPELVKLHDRLKLNRLVDVRKVKTESLSNILDAHLPSQQRIDFFSVDAEGLDLEVFQSNDWSKYKPDYIVAESLKSDLMNLPNDPVVAFLATVGYRAYGKTGNSVIFATQDLS